MQAVDCKIRGCGVAKKNDDTFELLAVFRVVETSTKRLYFCLSFYWKTIHAGLAVKTTMDTSIFDFH
jgi:hypothetical protein